jgi:hypothetical protein
VVSLFNGTKDNVNVGFEVEMEVDPDCEILFVETGAKVSAKHAT